MNEKFPLALNEGSVLAGQYIIEGVLGQGGFGITYVATDHKSGQKVAIKEFFPDTMATRDGNTVMSFTGERAEGFEYGKNCFLQEAQTLAQFIDIKNIVRIFTYFEENSTAYFVMEYVEGESFDEYIKKKGGKISFDEASKLLIPVMDALDAVHEKGIVHRDVTPDNIFICNDGTVKLLDFGAARYSIGDKSKSLDVVLKHGFAPKEQYTRHGRQGAFTDVYSLGATFYYAITGKKLPDSIDRLEDDDMIPPSNLGVDIPEDKEEVLFKAISVQPQDRFQNMRDFAAALRGEGAQEIGKTVAVSTGTPFGVPANAMQNSQNVNAAGSSDRAKKESPFKKGFVLPTIIAGGCLIIAAVIIGIVVSVNKPRTNADLEQSTTVDTAKKDEDESKDSGEDTSKEGGEDTSEDDGNTTTTGTFLTSIEDIGYFDPVVVNNLNNGGYVAETENGIFVSFPDQGLCLCNCNEGKVTIEKTIMNPSEGEVTNLCVVGEKVFFIVDSETVYEMKLDGSECEPSDYFAERHIHHLYANESGAFVFENYPNDPDDPNNLYLYYVDFQTGMITEAHLTDYTYPGIAILEHEILYFEDFAELRSLSYSDCSVSKIENPYGYILDIAQGGFGENDRFMLITENHPSDDDDGIYVANFYSRSDEYTPGNFDKSWNLVAFNERVGADYDYEYAVDDFTITSTSYFDGLYYMAVKSKEKDIDFHQYPASVVYRLSVPNPDGTGEEDPPGLALYMEDGDEEKPAAQEVFFAEKANLFILRWWDPGVGESYQFAPVDGYE